MIFKNIRMILRELSKQKLRTMLTLFGIFWGTTSVILLLTFGIAVKASTSKTMHGMGEAICVIWSGKTSISYGGFPKGRQLSFYNDDAQYLKDQVPLIGEISPQYSRYDIAVNVGDKKQNFTINAVWPEFQDMRNMVPREGSRFINNLDMENRRRVVFIGNEVEKTMFGDTNSVGKMMLIDGIPYKVIGVIIAKEQDGSYNGRDKYAIFMPTTTYLGIYGDRYVNNLVARAKNVNQTSQMKKAIVEAMAKKYRFAPEDTQALPIWDTTEYDQFLGTFFTGFTIFLGVVGVMTLIVGGIGIANIMYVIVEERTSEIGIKRAIGAKKRVILTQYLIETFVISSVGTIAGFLFARLLIFGINKAHLDDFVGVLILNPTIAILTIIIISSITFIAGWGPAKRASTLDPVVAING
ncbi:MAG: ABC transporter permease [Candidatus Marinimicrobia bacterium]|nr:ABC transporter permease [Candidatus Neomarinimicrobiota bacterium]MCK9484398.1 ABC transporter permease [Candidatus Neomarinimicrobiota bacterium]MCK9560559.1 ABC transporter permease [Candidatus Neomarinimicrobiota bacterium]MDD5062202.1 ABC transporter permease [Candidatus Neomarinimicrobiota bacterium]MDD5230897.1 ABC transporter permease [Candidatus Neomarinimicrobiota bacterium]